MPCEIECDVRKADVKWSVSPASPQCGRKTKVSYCNRERLQACTGYEDLLKPLILRQLLRLAMFANM